MKRSLHWGVTAGLLFVLATSAPGKGQAPARTDRPNIIVIMADDMGYSDIGPSGSEIRTPNLDRLAREGVRFRNFYNNAKCSPTRGSLMTGLYPHEAGFGELPAAQPRDPGAYQGYLPANAETLAEALHDAGYRTYMSGKWHLGELPQFWPRTRGFDRYFGLISGANSYFELDKNAGPAGARQIVMDDQLWTPPAEGYYATDAYTDFAVERIVEHKKSYSNQPFFLYLAHQAPHSPLHAQPEDIARYRGRYHMGWDALREERYARQRKLGIIDERFELTERPEGIPAWKDVPAAEQALWERRMEVYAAMIDRMDQGIGRVLDALERTAQRDNTLVIFLADNGATTEPGVPVGMGRGGRGQRGQGDGQAGGGTGRGRATAASNADDERVGGTSDPNALVGSRGTREAQLEPWASVSNAPYRLYKNFLHEGGIKTTMIASWPKGISQRGQITEQVGHVVDFMPTFLELAASRYPSARHGVTLQALAGQSLVPALKGKAFTRSKPMFWAYSGHLAVRDGDWKLVYNAIAPQPEFELFNLADDPTEHHDLSARFPQRVADMRTAWQTWAERVGANEAATVPRIR